MTFETGERVLIIAGEGIGGIGVVQGHELGVYLVDVGGVLHGKRADELIRILIVGETEDPDEERDDEEELDGPPFGLTTDQLSGFVERFIVHCVSRVRGVGRDQYARAGFQQFEGLSPVEVLGMLQEEIMDIANYAAMLFILTDRMRGALGETSD
ncbi:hypothetical protein GCM10012275_15280 [Longimycelium tulufanense]|uniref:Uncharacterized protein n=1 Tax=Longimycelium tulufanense TaxID=907463 RepID=A0A8J3FVK0_9PSEU|nr:hypothetical protein [Longimycelium tulufanense]GGM45161.1 hypothetical protein GCM10012275_15280 [Longimycelium tulufanense]